MLLPFKPWPELVQSIFRLSINNVFKMLIKVSRMNFRMQTFRVQYFVTIIFASQGRSLR